MQFELPFRPAARPDREPGFLLVAQRPLPLLLVKNARARRYVLRLRSDGSARVTIPRGGTVAEARRFAERNTAWLERQLLRRAQNPSGPAWTIGTQILFRGLPTRLGLVPGEEGAFLRLGTQDLRVTDHSADLRPEIEEFLWQLARTELPPRVFELAAVDQFPVRRVTIRSQRSRWGSCSRRGTISLNWRLVQTPAFVRDYIIWHELAHLKEMNHSIRFWREVARLCPEFKQAEQWLKDNRDLLRGVTAPAASRGADNCDATPIAIRPPGV
jgi:predicted metal-dependent hydrolase